MKNILVSSIVRDLFFNGLPVAANTYLKVLAAINSIMCIILFLCTSINIFMQWSPCSPAKTVAESESAA